MYAQSLEELAEAANLSRIWEWDSGKAVGSLSFDNGEIIISIQMTISVMDDAHKPFLFEVPDAGVRKQFSLAEQATAFGYNISRSVARR